MKSMDPLYRLVAVVVNAVRAVAIGIAIKEKDMMQHHLNDVASQ